MADINKEVGFNIRRIREERGLSQEKLAGLADLHRAYIGQIERGEKNIGLKNLEKIAKGLGVKMKDLRFYLTGKVVLGSVWLGSVSTKS